ncbi:MAG: hypothetical protein B6D62_00680 [Candidatus Cloacimonas sp. 4484_275]|nr:MAG: hypothetical protein B6D62_00680 [Candidatus Cloacimonas sp. 4484_275]
MIRNKKVELSTFIGRDCRIKGSVFARGGIKIDGEVDGKIESEGFVTIGDSGIVKSDIIAEECLVSGKVDGNIEVKDVLELEKTAVLNGDIIAKILKIHSGAVFNGNCSMNTDADKNPEKDEILLAKSGEQNDKKE